MKILVTGKNGLLGSAILNTNSNHAIVGIGRKDCDLTDYKSVKNTIKDVDAVIHTAGRIGGIWRNLHQPAQQFYDNIVINTNVIHACWQNKIPKLIGLGSICAYSSDVTTFTEDNLHEGEPFEAHRYFAYTKRMMDIQMEAYNKQYKTNYCCLLPANIFGENDNYDLVNSHVIPALIRKAYENKELKVWGTGNAKREFIYSKDLAKICIDLAEWPMLPERLIASPSIEYSIKEVVELIADYMNVKSISWETDKPDGQLSRKSDNSLLKRMFPIIKLTPIEEALRSSCKWFIDNYNTARK